MKKIVDYKTPKKCRHPEHDPPSMIVLSPGEYEHTCPSCGEKQTVIVPLGPSL